MPQYDKYDKEATGKANGGKAIYDWQSTPLAQAAKDYPVSKDIEDRRHEHDSGGGTSAYAPYPLFPAAGAGKHRRGRMKK